MLNPGITNCRELEVIYENTAIGCGSGGLPVLSTPRMVELMEMTCYQSVLEYLEEGEGTVGTGLEIRHVSAVPVGLTVTCRSELVSVEGRKLVFQVEATDEIGVVGTGMHERYIIDNGRFMEKTNIKKTKVTEMGNPSKPTGSAGRDMLKRMNRSHYEMTGWGLDHLLWQESDRILDVGCGGGQTLKRLAEMLPHANLQGIDYSEVSVALSRETNERFIQEGRMEIHEASVENLPFKDGTFDKTVAVETFYFWPDQEQGLREICRVLRPGGIFLLIAEVYGDAPMTEQERENFNRFANSNPTRQEYERLFLKGGFSEVHIDTKEGENWICVTGTAPV